MTTERFEVQRQIAAEPAAVFAVLRDPMGHVAIDSSGMLMDATGTPAEAVGTPSSSTWTGRRSTTSRWAGTT